MRNLFIPLSAIAALTVAACGNTQAADNGRVLEWEDNGVKSVAFLNDGMVMRRYNNGVVSVACPAGHTLEVQNVRDGADIVQRGNCRAINPQDVVARPDPTRSEDGVDG